LTTLPCLDRRPAWREPSRSGRCTWPGIPDLRVTIEELVAEGDKVAVRRSYEGTHRGELLGIPPTGKQVRIGGISIFRLTEGKIAEHWEQLDRLALMQQLGVIPAPAAPA
jgi:predicted ester cyclase